MNMIIPPKYSDSEVICRSKHISQQTQEKVFLLSKVYWNREYVGHQVYFVTTVGIDEKSIQIRSFPTEQI
jgi:REP element-mobilizing transposase RayT